VSQYLPFVIIGIVSGALYGLSATSLVLTFKTSGIFNFAQGSVSALAVFLFYYLHVDLTIAWPVSLAICLVVFAPVTGLALELLARALSAASDTIKIASTIGIMLTVLALGQIWFPSNPELASFLPTKTVHVLDVYVGYDQIIITVISVLITVAFFFFFRSSRLGMAMRGVVDDPDLVGMTGESPYRVRRWAWVIGTLFASLAGILLSPYYGIDTVVLTLIVVQAFGAAAIGFFSSMPLAFSGALLIGIGGSILTKFTASVPWLGGVVPALPFVVLFVVLIVTPRSKLVSRRFVQPRSWPESWHAPTRVRVLCAGIFLVLLAFVPAFAGTNLISYSAGVIEIILVLSLGLLIRSAGIVSLCQGAFAGIGAAAMAHFTSTLGIPWLPALLISGLIVVPIGAVVAIPAIRLTGVFLAVATLGFGIAIEYLFYSQVWMFGANGNVLANRPSLSFLNVGSDTGFYYVCLAVALLAVALTLGIRQGRLGRILRAMSDSQVAIEMHGANVNVAKVIVFCVSAFLAGISGALSASLYHFAVQGNFDFFISLELVVLVVIVTVGDPWYAILAAFSLSVLPAYLNLTNIQNYLAVFFGISAMMVPFTVAWLHRYAGTPVRLKLLAARLDRMLGGQRKPAKQPRDEGAPAMPSSRSLPGTGLEVRQLSVRYGGARAVNDASLRAPSGKITGLIGPNGAGKTTIFNACCGIVKASAGNVLLHGVDMTRLSPSARARRGLGRTFQRVQLFNSLTVRENLAMGREATMAGGNPLHQSFARRSDRAIVTAAIERATTLTGTAALLDRNVAELSTGQRRLIELARVLAGPFDLILLDEPSSGLDVHETTEFGRILTRVVAETGAGMLIVEHDMSLVRQICDQVYVLDFGTMIFQGTTAELLESPVVRAAYLGSERGEGGSELAEAESNSSI
jgi:ABC-type branched-subunit amino acid transport system ATPase component/ABC-type branched-subunit amino acid transport system permease subunit